MNPVCVSCGAPLPLSGGAVRKCSFCGREQHVAQPILREIQAKPTPRSYLLLVAGIPILVLLVSFALVWSSIRSSIRGSRTAPTAASPALVAWISRPIALAQVNGDGVPDVIGLGSWSPGGIQVTAVDGATGKPLWHVPAPEGQGANAWVYANGRDAVVIATPAPSLHALEAKTGKLRFDLRISSRPQDVTFGANCVAVLLDEQRVANLSLSSGSEAACAPSEAPEAWSKKHEHRPGTAIRSGSRTIQALLERDRAVTNPAPDRITIRASDGDKEIWKRPLPALDPIATEDGAAALVVSLSSGVFVLGRAHQRELTAAVLLDAATGRVISSQFSKPDDPPKKITHVLGAGDRVFVVNEAPVLKAYAASGQRLWP